MKRIPLIFLLIALISHTESSAHAKYTYNGYGWLTATEYGENDDLSANQHRYTERFLDFMRNGGIRRLQRHGLKADGVYGKVDNLHISYDGNRITTVL